MNAPRMITLRPGEKFILADGTTVQMHSSQDVGEAVDIRSVVDDMARSAGFRPAPDADPESVTQQPNKPPLAPGGSAAEEVSRALRRWDLSSLSKDTPSIAQQAALAEMHSKLAAALHSAAQLSSEAAAGLAAAGEATRGAPPDLVSSAFLPDPCADPLAPKSGLQGNPELAGGAESLPGPDDQDRLLARAEARLAEEMRWLGGALAEFARRTQAVREEIPSSAKFCKLVTGFFPMAAFQLSIALLDGPGRFTFKDDGALYLKQLGLQIEDFVREVDLEGRKFLAIALVDQSGRNVFDGAPKGDEL